MKLFIAQKANISIIWAMIKTTFLPILFTKNIKSSPQIYELKIKYQPKIRIYYKIICLLYMLCNKTDSSLNYIYIFYIYLIIYNFVYIL